MRVTIVIDCEGPAFVDPDTGELAPQWELAAILRTLAHQLDGAEDLAPLESEPLTDSLGQPCGSISTSY